MTQKHVPAEPDASSRRPLPPEPPLPLAYATPQPKHGAEDFGYLLAVAVRRLIFAVGVALLTGAIVDAFAATRRGDASVLAGVGAGMIALVVPFRKLSEPMRLGRNG